MRWKEFLAALFLILSISFVPAPHFTSVSWNMTEALDGQPVRLNLQGVSVSGHLASFRIYERDVGGTDDNVIANPPNLVLTSDNTYTTWIAEWQSDTDEGSQTNPPEYYFNVTLLDYPSSAISSQADTDMLKIYKCGDGTCNATYGEDCSTCPADCGACPSDCDLTGAYWDITEALEGQPVRLNLEGVDCNGKTITFEIREDDFLSSDFVSNPSSIVFGSPNTYGNWIVERVDDDDGLLQKNPPEYYFIASVQATSESETSPRIYEDMLKVQEIIQCIGINYCSDYTEESTCEADMCNIGEDNAPRSITCGETFDIMPGCNESTTCGCNWNDGIGRCESDWDSKLICTTGTQEIGSCSYTETGGDNCEEDGILTRSLIALWEWAPGNEITQNDPSGIAIRCIDLMEIIRCPASAQVYFFRIENLIITVIVIILIYVAYFIHKKKKNSKKKIKKRK